MSIVDRDIGTETVHPMVHLFRVPGHLILKGRQFLPDVLNILADIIGGSVKRTGRWRKQPHLKVFDLFFHCHKNSPH